MYILILNKITFFNYFHDRLINMRSRISFAWRNLISSNCVTVPRPLPSAPKIKMTAGFLWKVDLQASSRARSSQDILNNGILFFIPGFYPLIFVYTATGWELLLFIASNYPQQSTIESREKLIICKNERYYFSFLYRNLKERL